MKIDALLILHYLMGAIFALFPIVNPFSTVPIFTTLMADRSPEERQRQGDRSCMIAAFVLLLGLAASAVFIRFLDLPIDTLRTGGGLAIAFWGFTMLFPRPIPVDQYLGEGRLKFDYSLIPLAIPSLSGAGSLAVMMVLATKIETLDLTIKKIAGYTIIGTAVLVVACLSAIILRCSDFFMSVVGLRGLDAIRRFMGLAMVCVGVEFVSEGVFLFLGKVV